LGEEIVGAFAFCFLLAYCPLFIYLFISSTGQVADMLSTLEVGDKWDNNSYQQHAAKEEHSLLHQSPGKLAYPSDSVHVPLSNSSELAFALQLHGARQDTITQESVDKEMDGQREQNHSENHNDGHGHGQEQSEAHCLNSNGQDHSHRQHQADTQGNEHGRGQVHISLPDGGEMSPPTPTTANAMGVVGMDVHHMGSMNHDQIGTMDEVLEMHRLAGYMEGSGVAEYTMY
jgi:hypothetical protein